MRWENDPKPHKPPRLKHYDYTTPGYYFVTFNTRLRRRDILAKTVPPSQQDVGTAAFGGPVFPLTPAGEILRKLIDNIDRVYPDVHVDCYAIMPDHVHLLLSLGCGDDPYSAGAITSPTPLSQIINSLKGLSTKRWGSPLWQDEYYDHIIRDPGDLTNTRRYIQGNPIITKEELL